MTDENSRILALEFSSQLRDNLSPLELRHVISLNMAEPADSLICHSHDLCDANEIMRAAFATIFDREPVSSSDADAALLNAAWSLAKASYFFA